MIIHAISHLDDTGGDGYSYNFFPSKQAAMTYAAQVRRDFRDDCGDPGDALIDYYTLDFDCTKRGVIDLLNRITTGTSHV